MKLINEDSFDKEVLQVLTPVIVYFGATYCGPCHKQLPIVEELSKETKNIKFCKADVDDCTNLVSKFNIKASPSILLFHKGQLVKSVSGLQSKTALLEFIK